VVALTGSLKLMTTFELTGTFVAEFTGVVPCTVGATSPPPIATIEMSSIASACAFVVVPPVATE
jgi:hypothetical protein